ncbi:MAG: DUF169 domain-containing protein [Syntrophales bacterium]
MTVPWVAACQAVGIMSYEEAKKERPRCLIGLTDISARRYLKGQNANDKMTFTIPFRRLQEMEANIAGSFLEGSTWADLLK